MFRNVRRAELLIALATALCVPVHGQPVTPVRPQVAVLPAGNVVIYENENFGGRSQVLASGDYALTAWKGSSIKVPQGLVALVYEFADAGGGYGISVDFLEDHSDFSTYGLRGNVSFVTVFSSSRQNLYWVRNSILNGQFVSGHWAVNRAGGNPVSTVAVASPPLPSRLPPQQTVVSVHGNIWNIDNLGPQSAVEAGQWNVASSRMGVIGSDYRGPQEIGSAAFERASHNIAIPDWINFWYPQKEPNDHRSIVYFKRTLTGVIIDSIAKTWTGKVPDGAGGSRTISGTYEISSAPHVANISGTYPDHDLNIDVAPFVDYMYLIRDGHKPERSAEVQLKDLVDSDNDPCIDPFIKVEAEIDATDSAKNALLPLLQKRIGKQIVIYGPWIYDKGHCYHPEIHPAEEVWWTESAGTDKQTYHLNVFCDASQRFWWRYQMDDGTKLHPWGAPPITGVFAIAFEIPLNSGPGVITHGKRFELETVDSLNVVSIPGSNQAYNLLYQGQTLATFVPNNDQFKVSYEGIGLKPGTTNVVHGFLVLESTVGTVKQIATKVKVTDSPWTVWVDIPEGANPDKVDQRFEFQIFKKQAGHNLFTVTVTNFTNGLVIR